jgi:hypothetical protein
MTHQDISATADLAEGERMFRTVGGVMALVVVEAVPHENEGHFAFRVAARALADDGSPIPDHHGKPITAGPHMVTVQPDSDVELGEVICTARALMLDRLDRAVGNARAIATLGGVRIHSDPLH